MKRVWLLLAWFSIACVVRESNAQTQEFKDPNQQTVAVSEPLGAENGRKARSGPAALQAIATDAVRRYAASFGTAEKNLQKVQSSVDSLGVLHVTYKQVNDHDVPVYAAELLVHVNPLKNSVRVNGRVSRGPLPSESPAITLDESLARARDEWGKTFRREATDSSSPILVVFDASLSNESLSSAPRLAYQVDIGSEYQPTRYFVDAGNGSILHSLSLATHANRVVFDCSYKQGVCVVDTYSPEHNYTFGRSEGQPERGPNPLGLLPTKAFPRETDNLYTALGSAHQYFLTMFNRNGPNNRGGIGDGSRHPVDATPAKSYLDFTPDEVPCPNAFFNSMTSLISFCTGLTSIDIVAHEYSHAVMFHTTNLSYERQSGALNESFADIFGEAVERHATGTHDWLLGVGTITGSVRSMRNPSEALLNPITQKPENGLQPDRFYSPLYYCGLKDNGGVHVNSGVLNHAAYLIATGGTFNGCTIQGLGDEKMERIFYRALTTYLTKSSRFYDAYLALRTATGDLYSLEEQLEVEKALRAVELNQVGACSGRLPDSPGCDTVIDECPDTPNLVQAGPCGCGSTTTDEDGDGRADCLGPPDNCPSDPAKTEPGACGCGRADSDTNGNGVADCLDPKLSEIVPPKPRVVISGKRLGIVMQEMKGFNYVVQVDTTPPKKRKKQVVKTTTKYYLSESSAGYIAKPTKGSVVAVRFLYIVPQSKTEFSLFSPFTTVTVKK